MILGDDLTPLSQLSAAFLAPKSALHIQFAYYESALAVEFLVQTAGLPALKGILEDLGAGKTINEGLPARTHMTLDQLDKAFARFAREKAEGVAPGVTWEEYRPGGRREFGGRCGLAQDPSQELSGPTTPGGAACRRTEMAGGQGSLARIEGTLPGVCRIGERLRAAGLSLQTDVRLRRGTRGSGGIGGARRRTPRRPTCG